MKNNNKGFSLVELIVVIAIMAILAAVAVVGFSVYIPKAQQASDKQMFADIEDQLIYAGYAGGFEEGEGGYVVLSPEGVVAIEGEGFKQVLINAYGENYEDELKLAYEEWGNNYLYAGLVGGGAQSVYGSTYYANSDKLMGQVQEITNAALAILDSDSDASTEKMLELFAGPDGSQDFLNEVALMYGYTDENGNGDISKVSNEELPNFLVLAVAADITAAINKPGEHTMSQASGLVQNFALYNAYAATDEGKAAGFDKEYEKFVAAINDENATVGSVAEAYNALKGEAEKSGSTFQDYKTEDASTDMSAFAAMLGGLTGSTGANPDLTKDNMKDANFFTTGVGNELFGTYIGSVESFVGVSVDDTFAEEMAQPGTVGFYFTYINSEIIINNTLPVQ